MPASLKIKPAKPPRDWKKTTKIAIVSLLALTVVGLGAAYCLGYFSRDPRLVQLRQTYDETKDLVDKKDYKAAADKFFKATTDTFTLPASLRQAAADEGRQMMAQHMRDVLKLPPDQRMAAIDNDIDFMQEMRKRFEDMRGKGLLPGAGTPQGAPGGGSGSPPNGTPPNGAAPASGGPPPGPFGGPGGPRPSPDSPEAKQWRTRFLSSVPVEDRVAMSQYRELMQARAIQRGISMPGPGGGPGGPGGPAGPR